MMTCSYYDVIDGPCTLVGLHTWSHHDGISLRHLLLCEKHWEATLADESQRVLFDLRNLVEKLLASPELDMGKWVRRGKALQEEIDTWATAVARMKVHE